MSHSNDSRGSTPPPTASLVARRPGCSAITAAGDPCRAPALSTGPLCWHHESAVKDERLQAQRRGGLNSVMSALKKTAAGEFPPIDFATGDGIRAVLESAARAVVAGGISPAQANSVAGLANVALRVVEVSLQARLAALEEELAGSSGGTTIVMEGGAHVGRE